MNGHLLTRFADGRLDGGVECPTNGKEHVDWRSLATGRQARTPRPGSRVLPVHCRVAYCGGCGHRIDLDGVTP